MKRSVFSCAGIIAFTLAIAGTTEANAGSGRAAGLIGGMSAAEVLAWPYGPYGGFGIYADYPATAAYVRPLGPPPGTLM